jgi:hypothetical protein
MIHIEDFCVNRLAERDKNGGENMNVGAFVGDDWAQTFAHSLRFLKSQPWVQIGKAGSIRAFRHFVVIPALNDRIKRQNQSNDRNQSVRPM